MSAALKDPEEGASAPSYDFDGDFQTKIAALVMRDSDFARRTEGLIKPSYFTNEAEAGLVAIVVEYARKYRTIPSRPVFMTLLKEAVVSRRIRKDLIDDVKDKVRELLTADTSDREFILEKVSEFARHSALRDALMQSVYSLEKNDFAKIEKLIKGAMLVGESEDVGEYDFFKKVADRTEMRKEIAAGTLKRAGITTGHPDLDKYLYHHGWGKRELSVIMGAAKAGKSMSLGEFGKNAAMAGYNVLYVTLEVSADIIADRLDAALSDVMMKELTTKPFEVSKKITDIEARSGRLILREYPTGSMKPSQLRRLIENYRARGVLFDMVIVDYADIMAPESRAESQIDNLRSIYVELRAISQEFDCALLTATQTNREGAKATTARMTDVAEDFNKIRIADIVISINATEEEKGLGEARLYFAAVRNGESGMTLNIKQDRSRMKFILKITGVS